MMDFDSRMARSILTADIPPDPVLAGEPPDTSTISYFLAIRPVFELLRCAAAQLAAFSVLVVAGSDAAGPEHPLLVAARTSLGEATDGVHVVLVCTDAARHHHRHLLRAAAAIRAALAGLASQHDAAALDATLQRLKAGWQELHCATAALPGFEMVGLNQSCCAQHVFVRPAI